MVLHHGSGRHARDRNRALRYLDDPPVTEGGNVMTTREGAACLLRRLDILPDKFGRPSSTD